MIPTFSGCGCQPTLSSAMRPPFSLQLASQRHLIAGQPLPSPQRTDVLADPIDDIRNLFTRTSSNIVGGAIGGATETVKNALVTGLTDGITAHASQNPNPWRGIIAVGTALAIGAAASVFLVGYGVGRGQK